MRFFRMSRIIRLICFLVSILAFIMFLSTLLQDNHGKVKHVTKDIKHMPEIQKFEKAERDLALPDEHGVVWANAPNFVPLELIHRRQFNRKNLPQSYKAELIKLDEFHMKNISDNPPKVLKHTVVESNSQKVYTQQNFKDLKQTRNEIHQKDSYQLNRDKSTLKFVRDTPHTLLPQNDKVLVNQNENIWIGRKERKLASREQNNDLDISNNEIDIPHDVLRDVQVKTPKSDSSKTCHQAKPKVYTFYTQNDQFCLKRDNTLYFRTVGKLTCFTEGTNFAETNRKSNRECVCKDDWYGQECSMPDIVFKSEYPYHYGVAVREANRRIIYAMPFNHEFDLLEAKVNELASVVDVFIILESNITAAGQPKRTSLLDMLQSGFLGEFHHKLIYLQLTYFPKEAYTDGWVMDRLLRNYIGRIALQHVLQNVLPDDIIIMHDADEIPVRKALLFLKIHDGYPEPFGFIMKHRVLGFFWRTQEDISNIYGGATVKFVNFILKNETYFLRNPGKVTNNDPSLVGKYRHDYGGRIHSWSFGTKNMPSGWHCSWCLDPSGIQYKLLAAHLSDTPRWGTQKNLTRIGYLRQLILTGHWFDNKTTYIETSYTTEQSWFAPKYLLQNYEKFKHLLDVQSAVSHSSPLSNLLINNIT